MKAQSAGVPDPGNTLLVTLTTDDLRALILSAVAECLDGSLPGSQPAREVLTRKEAADVLRASVATLDRLVRDGALPSHRVGDSPRFLRSELLAYVMGTLDKPAPLRAVGGVR